MSNAVRKIDADLDLNGNRIRAALVEGYYSSSEMDARLEQFQPDLRIVQNPDGISIGGTQLQSATEAQGGLMTKEAMKELKGKQNKLSEGAGIKIENDIISVIGGSGGGGHMASLKPITSSNKAEDGGYLVTHNLGSYNLIYQIRTNTLPVEFVQARTVAPDENSLKIYLSKDLGEGEGLTISIIACDVTSSS